MSYLSHLMKRTFRTALLAAIDADPEMSLRRVATLSGVSYEQLKKLNQRPGATVRVEDAIAIARVFGKSVEDFLADPGLRSDIEIVDLVRQLPDEDRRRLIVLGKALRDADDQHTELSSEE